MDNKGAGSVCTVAIIVTYFPKLSELQQLIASLKNQVNRIIIVDNGSLEETPDCLRDTGDGRIDWLFLGRNYGVAVAQNSGIDQARMHGATHVVLLDQDSIPHLDMISRLLEVHEALEVRNIRVAAVGPLFLDSESGAVSSFVQYGLLGMKQVECAGDDRFVEVDALLASGSLISIAALDKVGTMDEGLFIDYVDTEWIMRARALNYLAFGACDAYMGHALGENRKKLWFLRWRYLPMHKPFRFYYIFRNAILLMRRKNANRDWRRCETINLLRLALVFGLFVAPRLEYIGMIVKGVIHGFQGKTGRLEITRNAGAD